jgi:pyridoxamine 5'-phosphate oxidase
MSMEPSDQAAESTAASLTPEQARTAGLQLMDNCGIAMVGSNGPDGYPHIKALLKVGAEGLKNVWFTTNTSTARVGQFLADPKASVYFVDVMDYKGLMLVGEIEVLSDRESRERFWRYGNELYYPQGIDDPDYSVMRFTAKWGNYYHGLKNTTFDI